MYHEAANEYNSKLLDQQYKTR